MIPTPPRSSSGSGAGAGAGEPKKANPLFREAAMQNLSSPDQLNQLVKITQPYSWIALSAAGLALAVALAWSIFGRLPTIVTGEGILIRKGGTFSIVSQGSGVVTEIADLTAGKRVARGQVLARLSQPELGQQVAAQQAVVARLQAEQREASSGLATLAPAQGKALLQQQDAQQKLIEGREAQLKSLRSVEQAQAELVRDGLITRQRQEDIKQQIFSVQNDINSARNSLQRLAVERLQTTSQNDDKQRDAASRLKNAEGVLADLVLKVKIVSEVTSTHDGVVVEAMAMRGDMVRTGQPIASVEINDDKLQAVIYLPPNSNAKLIKPGMVAQISPVVAKKERFGFLVSKVINVSQFPSTEAGMLSLVDNPALVRQLSKAGPPIAVTVELVRDTATRSGYRWSSSAGAEVEVSSGMVATGGFIVEEKRPIALVIPLIRETVGL